MITQERIKQLREEKAISQMQLANALNISQSAIAKWELGKTEPTADYIIRLAIFFDVTTDYLLGLENEDGTRNTQIIKDSFNINGNGNNISFRG